MQPEKPDDTNEKMEKIVIPLFEIVVYPAQPDKIPG